MKKFIILISTIFISNSVFSGGNTEFVKFPEKYRDTFTLYSTQNRQNNEQVVDLYANETAIKSANDGNLADGAVIIMEVYKTIVNEDGERETGPEGVFKKADLAAIAVMEKRSDWSASYPAEERTGNWGYAFYDAKGMPKDNDLDCVACHTPLANQDYLFTFPRLTGK